LHSSGLKVSDYLVRLPLGLAPELACAELVESAEGRHAAVPLSKILLIGGIQHSAFSIKNAFP